MTDDKIALDILEQLMLLNSNIDALTTTLARMAEHIRVPTMTSTETTTTISKAPKPPRDPSAGVSPPPIGVEFEPVMSTGPTIEVTNSRGRTKQQPAYVYIGQEQFDPTKPLPECFPNFESDDCTPDTCPYRKECQEHPSNELPDEVLPSDVLTRGFTPRTEKTIIQPAVFDGTALADEIAAPQIEQALADEEIRMTADLDYVNSVEAERTFAEEEDSPPEEKPSKSQIDREKYRALADDIKVLQNAQVITEKDTGEHEKDYKPPSL